jgi:hypothetical protein
MSKAQTRINNRINRMTGFATEMAVASANLRMSGAIASVTSAYDKAAEESATRLVRYLQRRRNAPGSRIARPTPTPAPAERVCNVCGSTACPW